MTSSLENLIRGVTEGIRNDESLNSYTQSANVTIDASA
jgi:hypothetical protein